MYNKNADKLINDCKKELDQIEKIIDGLGIISNIYPYLTKYTIVKSCGTIEQTFKIILTEYCISEQSKHVQNYIENTFKNNSMNPSIENMHQSLRRFDGNWNIEFTKKIQEDALSEKIKLSLNSLNKLRNTFAHGGNPTASFFEIKEYFADACKIIIILDNVIHSKPVSDIAL